MQLLYFFAIILVFMIAFGVSTQSLMYRNQYPSLALFYNVFFPSYFVIGGEYYTRDIIMKSSLNQCSDATDAGYYGDCADANGANITQFIYVIYLLLLDVLLVNLLIAIFK